MKHNVTIAQTLRRFVCEQKKLFPTIYCFSFQLTSWLEELQQELQISDIADSVDGSEQLLAQFNQQRKTTVEATNNTVSEGTDLLNQLR